MYKYTREFEVNSVVRKASANATRVQAVGKSNEVKNDFITFVSDSARHDQLRGPNSSRHALVLRCAGYRKGYWHARYVGLP